MTDQPVTPDNTSSQELRREFFTLVVAQVVFLVNNEMQMITRQTFSSSPEPQFTARHLLHIQNAVLMQVRSEILRNQPGTEFKGLDVIILNLIPAGHMTRDEFWAGMDQVSAAAEEAVAAAQEQLAPGDNNILPFPSN